MDPVPRLIDVSPRLSPQTPVWPGDQPLAIRWVQRLVAGDPSNLSAITLTPHLGAHADAPLHLFDGEHDMSEVDLHRFLGPAWVVDFAGSDARRSGERVVNGNRAVTARELAGIDLTGAERLLLRTRGVPADAGAASDYAYLAADAADLFVDAGLLLVGIDTPSVDAAPATELPIHRRLLAAGIAILEGLDLTSVEAGRYELIALPLKLAGVEASPVRAVLRPLAGGGPLRRPRPG
jgi:arylformamidase